MVFSTLIREAAPLLRYRSGDRARYKLLTLAEMVERGQLKPVVDSVLPLNQVAQVHQRLERGGVKGKIVLRVIKE